MGIGMGYIASGLNSEIDNQRRQKREDERLGLEKSREGREQKTFENQQEDRPLEKEAKGLGLKKARRDDEIGALEAEMKKKDMETMERFRGLRDQTAFMKEAKEYTKSEEEYSGAVYKAYKSHGSAAAARLLNRMRDSEVNKILSPEDAIPNVADFVEYVDPKTKKKMIKVVDAEGNAVTEGGRPMVMDADEMEKVFGVKAEKGTFSESERGVLDTRTGKFKEHGPGVSKKKNLEQIRFDRSLVNDGTKLVVSAFGGSLDPISGAIAFPDGKNARPGLTAVEIQSDLTRAGEDPERAANKALQLVENGMTIEQWRQTANRAGPARKAAGLPKVASATPRDVYRAPNGRSVTRKEIEATAANRGISTEQVISILNLQ